MNKIRMEFDAISENESFARTCVAVFAARLDPTLEEINDVKTAVSEAVTNSIIHGYDEMGGMVFLEAAIDSQKRELLVSIKDTGKGIADIKKAMEPLFTTGSEKERSGMGFTFMEVFMDEVFVDSELGLGTTVTMRKVFKSIN